METFLAPFGRPESLFAFKGLSTVPAEAFSRDENASVRVYGRGTTIA